ncbi:MAG: amino acid permease, partial [Alphaproteobacteria bacterium]
VSLVVVASPGAVAGGAPLALIADRALESSGAFIALVAIFAVINGGLIQIVMASRVLYGMANQGWMPAWLGVVNARTRTPVAATVLVGGVVLVAALALPVAALAQATSFILLLVYALVNLSLLRLRRRRGAAAAPRARFTVPLVVPVLGCVGSASLALALVLLHLV